MTRLILAAAMLAAIAAPAAAQQTRVLGQETTIAFASSGGIRNFQPEARDSNIVYLQDRTLRWYRVTLTGPCLPDVGQNTIVYRTSPGDRLDRFSQIGSTRYPGRVCGITSIVNSLPPEGQPGAPK